MTNTTSTSERETSKWTDEEPKPTYIDLLKSSDPPKESTRGIAEASRFTTKVPLTTSTPQRASQRSHSNVNAEKDDTYLNDPLLFHLHECLRAVDKLSTTLSDATMEWEYSRQDEKQRVMQAHSKLRATMQQLAASEVDLDLEVGSGEDGRHVLYAPLTQPPKKAAGMPTGSLRESGRRYSGGTLR